MYTTLYVADVEPRLRREASRFAWLARICRAYSHPSPCSCFEFGLANVVMPAGAVGYVGTGTFGPCCRVR
ncbi:hypothetical protein AQJ91_29355 [Streptomyces dysideae]|uniref:Uncharacterized protein n=1 Tax=Streptomyces dysideae TaxID=909626 RepID=A0A101UVU7_9ACTN|nr:hypothetical protein AQJ91_29355 [Streptomyces dysideae]